MVSRQNEKNFNSLYSLIRELCSDGLINWRDILTAENLQKQIKEDETYSKRLSVLGKRIVSKIVYLSHEILYDLILQVLTRWYTITQHDKENDFDVLVTIFNTCWLPDISILKGLIKKAQRSNIAIRIRKNNFEKVYIFWWTWNGIDYSLLWHIEGWGFVRHSWEKIITQIENENVVWLDEVKMSLFYILNEFFSAQWDIDKLTELWNILHDAVTQWQIRIPTRDRIMLIQLNKDHDLYEEIQWLLWDVQKELKSHDHTFDADEAEQENFYSLVRQICSDGLLNGTDLEPLEKILILFQSNESHESDLHRQLRTIEIGLIRDFLKQVLTLGYNVNNHHDYKVLKIILKITDAENITLPDTIPMELSSVKFSIMKKSNKDELVIYWNPDANNITHRIGKIISGNYVKDISTVDVDSILDNNEIELNEYKMVAVYILSLDIHEKTYTPLLSEWKEKLETAIKKGVIVIPNRWREITIKEVNKYSSIVEIMKIKLRIIEMKLKASK